MTPTNLLHIYAVFGRNLQLIIRWWLWITQRPWGSCTPGIHILIGFWRGMLSLLTSWTFYGILVSVLSSAGMMCLCLLSVPWSSYPLLQPIRHRGHLHLHHDCLDVMYQWCWHDHHFGSIEVLCEGSPHLIGLSYSHPGEMMRALPVASYFLLP